MRRIQIYIDEPLDDTLSTEAKRRGISKAALIREAVAQNVGPATAQPEDSWQALIGCADIDPVDDIDEVIYGLNR